MCYIITNSVLYLIIKEIAIIFIKLPIDAELKMSQILIKNKE